MIQYDPFQDFIILKDAFKSIENGYKKQEKENFWTPNVDVLESEKNIILRCDLPGVQKENIKIDVVGDTLSISGEKKMIEDQDVKYHKIERINGAFSRTFKIGVPIDQENIKAAFKNGVLEIIVPKAEKLAQKKIEITN